jgi:hypothetical protein
MSMKSRLLNVAAATSLLLFLITLALWIRGYWVRDGIWYSTPTARYSVHSYRGRIWLWALSGGRAASDSIWITPAKLHGGFVLDSTPDSYLYQYLKGPKWGRLDGGPYSLEAPASGLGASSWQALGFRYVQNNAWLPIAQVQFGYPTARSTAIYIPHWAISVLFALLPLAVLFRVLRRRHRVRHGLCAICGYDLRGSPGRCPECGALKGDVAPAAAA